MAGLPVELAEQPAQQYFAEIPRGIDHGCDLDSFRVYAIYDAVAGNEDLAAICDALLRELRDDSTAERVSCKCTRLF